MHHVKACLSALQVDNPKASKVKIAKAIKQIVENEFEPEGGIKSFEPLKAALLKAHLHTQDLLLDIEIDSDEKSSYVPYYRPLIVGTKDGVGPNTGKPVLGLTLERIAPDIEHIVCTGGGVKEAYTAWYLRF
jgi:hypothetical protein